MWEHFLDTLFLLVLEIFLAVVLHFAADHHIGLTAGFVNAVDVVAKWLCVSTLMLFGVEFVIVLSLDGFNDIMKTMKKRGTKK